MMKNVYDIDNFYLYRNLVLKNYWVEGYGFYDYNITNDDIFVRYSEVGIGNIRKRKIEDEEYKMKGRKVFKEIKDV